MDAPNPPQPTKLWIRTIHPRSGPPLPPHPYTATVTKDQSSHVVEVLQRDFRDYEQIKHMAELMQKNDKGALRTNMSVMFLPRSKTAEETYYDLFGLSHELYFNNKKYPSDSKDPHRRLEDDFGTAGKWLNEQLDALERTKAPP
jgi:hypothetical protein